MRSSVGAFKVSRVVPQYSKHLTPLNSVTASCQSQETIFWTDELRDVFQKAQHALQIPHCIILPRPEDQLWIVTDGAVRNPGIGGTPLHNARKQAVPLRIFLC